MKPDNPPAFPRPNTVADANAIGFKPGVPGMTLRDWFAGQALIGLITISGSKGAVEKAYSIADEMLKHREKSDGN